MEFFKSLIGLSRINLLCLGGLILLATNCTPVESTESEMISSGEPDREYYQIMEYTFASEEQEALTDQYLKDAFLPALKRQGISNIGVFKNRITEEDTIQRTYVLIPFASLEQFAALDAKLDQDDSYTAAGQAYIKAKYDQAPYERVNSTVLRAFEDMPQMAPSGVEGPREDRIYELRSYESATEAYHKNKVDMFNAGGEVVLFDELDFNAVFYGEVISGDKMPNLMYMTTFPNMASRDEHWQAFVDAPKWKEISSMEQYQNNVSHIDIYFLYPTAYSDY